MHTDELNNDVNNEINNIKSMLHRDSGEVV